MGRQFTPSLAAVQQAAFIERLRQSLYVIPGLCLAVGVVLAELTVRFGGDLELSWLLDDYRTSFDSARVVLGAIATAMVTVITLMLTLTLVAIQLASSQRSPRTVVNFLDDRFQQVTVGVVLGTGSYSLWALLSIDTTSSADRVALVAVFLTVAALFMLIMSVDRTAKRLSVSTLLNDLGSETCALVNQRYGGDRPESPPLDGPVVGGFAEGSIISTDRAGWVQYIDEAQLLDALPDDASIRLLHPVGSFVLQGMVIVELDTDDLDEGVAHAVRRAIVIGDNRTMQQDVGFGITRLNDIGLRALSPGVNDPNTASEVVLRLAQVVLALQEKWIVADHDRIGGHRVQQLGLPGHADFTRAAFEPLRRAAANQQAVLETIRSALVLVAAETERRDLPGGVVELRHQLVLVERALAELGSDPAADPQTEDRPELLP